MPKHPISPPYKSTLVISKSKDIQKFMTTIPKPIVTCKWKSWNMKISKENTLIWYPSEYTEILDHLENQWKVIYNKSFDSFVTNENLLYFIYYNGSEDITSINAWKLQIKKQVKLPGKRWSWKYDPNLPVYLIYVQYYDSMGSDYISSPPLIRRIIEDGLRIILCNN